MHDIELLRSYVRDRSEDAFAELVRRNVDLVYGAALRQSGSRHRAEDIVQAVFIDLARKAPRLCSRTDLAGWLFTATRYAALRVKRDEARRQANESAAAQQLALMKNEEPHSRGWEQCAPVIDECLCRLSDRERTAIVLRFFKNQTFAQVGAALSQSEEAARKCIERALDKLNGYLAKQGIRSTSSTLALSLASLPAAVAPPAFATTLSSVVLTQAATGGGAGALAAAITFMSATKTIAVSSTVVCLVLLGGAWQVHREAHAMEQAHARLTTERAAAAAALPAPGATANPAPASRPQGGPPANRPAAPVAAGIPPAALEELQNDPEIQALTTAYVRKSVRERHRLFFQVQPLTPEQAQRVEDILVTENLKPPVKWVPVGTTAIVNVRDTVSPEAREMLRETLGDLGLSRLTALSDMTNRGVIDRVTTGSFGGEPLSQPQVLWLIDTLSARVERQDPSTGFKYDTPDWDRLLLEAPAKFGPAQVTHLRALVQAERERRADSLQRLKLRTKQ